MHKNSITAHENNKDLKRYSSSERLIIAAMGEMVIIDRKNKYTMHQIADYMRVGLNAISGRFGPLVKKGALYEDGNFSYKAPYRGGWKTYHRTYFCLTYPPQLPPVKVTDHTAEAIKGE
jgi:predicted transcriptional regulator